MPIPKSCKECSVGNCVMCVVKYGSKSCRYFWKAIFKDMAGMGIKLVEEKFTYTNNRKPVKRSKWRKSSTQILRDCKSCRVFSKECSGTTKSKCISYEPRKTSAVR